MPTCILLLCPRLAHNLFLSRLFHFHLLTITSLAHDPAAMEKEQIRDSPPPVHHGLADHAKGRQFSIDGDDVGMVHADQNELKKDLKGRHMQMIAMLVSPNTLP